MRLHHQHHHHLRQPPPPPPHLRAGFSPLPLSNLYAPLVQRAATTTVIGCLAWLDSCVHNFITPRVSRIWMALGDLMASRFSQSSVTAVVSNHHSHHHQHPNHHHHLHHHPQQQHQQNHNHFDDYVSSHGGDEDLAASQRRDSETSASSSGYGNAVSAVAQTAATSTSIPYIPQPVVLCELRHDAFEASVPTGPSDSGLVSKWRPKDRAPVSLIVTLGICIFVFERFRYSFLTDPFSMPPQKALETIGKTLSIQYERWQPRARYKVQLDPTVDEVKKLCNTCRKYAKSERVLFHYNGHGVPKPTANGEIWLFNKSYTQYIPLPICDLDSWLKTPSIYVFDCSAAGMIVNAFIELQELNASSSAGSGRDCILLAACEAHETLPQSDEFPADVFTSCLTTPIKMALRWFYRRSLLCESLDYSLIDKIPGRQNDRKTLLGELNWIFTAVTDTIAWNVLPHDLFQRLFRQDLLVASLFRNFLLAERIMRSANCSPVSHPMLPPTHQHHMWDAWDMAAEICLSQLPSLVEDPNAEFQSSPFFTEQLTAFEVLLSQCHRFRALVLLGRFLDMGPWAVDLALSVGIFPYVLKLLQTTTPELRQILVFIWTKILALDKSCQVDLVKDGGHTYFIRFLDSMEAYPEQRAMAAFVLAVIVDGHRRGQEACIEAGLLHVCLKHLKDSTPNDGQSEPLFLQWLCLCLGKLWEDFTEAQLLGLQADAPAIYAPLLCESQPEVRASAVFALATLLDVGGDACRDGVGGDDECDDDEKIKAEISIVRSILSVVSDGSPLVRAEVAVALARFAFGHKHHLKSIAAAYWKPQSTSLLNSPSLAHLKGANSGYPSSNQYVPHASIVSSQIGPLTRVGGENSSAVRDGRVSTSSPLTTSGIMHGSPLSDDSSQHSDSGLLNDVISNGVVHHSRPKPLDNSLYSQCVLAMCTLAKDPSPRIASLGRRVLSIIGIEQVVTKPMNSAVSGRPGDPTSSQTTSLAGLARSSSWFDMNAGHLPLTFRTPPVSPPRPSYLTGMRRVYSLEFRPHLMNSPDSGLADPLLGSSGAAGGSERSLLPQSTIYNWSCGHFSKPLLSAPEDAEEILVKREERERFASKHIPNCQHSSVSNLNNRIASWDTKFETGTKTALLQPFSPVVIAADENERIRVWNYEEGSLLNGFDNHEFPEKGISKLCLVNEFDDSLLLVASCDGNIRVWKDYTLRGKQKLVTAFSSIQGHKPGVRSLNAVVDWQQQSGYLYASGEVSSIMLWDLEKEQLVNSIPSSSDCSVSALTASLVHGGQFAAGFADGSVRLYDVRTPEMLVCATEPHTQRVVGMGFQPGLDPAKIISASQAGDIQFLDIRNSRDSYLTIDAHRGSLTALAVHRHAPIIASGSAKQIIKVFSLEGEQLASIRYHLTIMAQKIGPVSCLAFHPYQVLLAAGATDPLFSIYADDSPQGR
ncbi:Regulatory-associated protein of TOR 1 [Turnera subulata]|uniref:Regulatory-associated protein of TOR 1 n=1 Tax=Turnera subulata TaxID=218843 RepID=A0A9Q0JG78_9ROSI|nr:Regulatory-associated protein of TOR 1 [Turnera subulata]